MDQKQTHCLGGRHYSNSVNIVIYERVNTKRNKTVKIRLSQCDICERNKVDTYLSK